MEYDWLNDFSGGSDWASNSYDYNAPADTQVDYNSYTPQQDYGAQQGGGTSGAMQGGFADTQGTTDATPFWDFSFGAGAGGTPDWSGYANYGVGAAPGLPTNVQPSYASAFSTGSGATPGLTVGPSGAAAYSLGAASPQAGITGGGPGMGDYGVGGVYGPDNRDVGGKSVIDKQTGILEQARAGLADLSKFGRENADLVKLGTQLAGYLAAKPQQAAAKAATAQQAAVVQENQQQARANNAQAAQSFDEARSLYNPQQMAVRGMAQQTAATQRGIDDLRKQLQRRGLSQASIDAEVRRARLGGSTDATTAYTKGLDVGRTAQQSALTAAKNLQSTVPGADFYGTQAANAQAQGQMTSAQLAKLLEDYLGQPTKTVQEARTKAAGVTAQ